MAVVLSWAALYSREAGQPLSGTEMALLAACIWLGYAADRWCDCRKDPTTSTWEARHQWFWKYRQLFLPAWLGILLGAITAAPGILTPASLLAGVGLAGLAFLYTIANSGNHLPWLVKSLKTALLLSLAVILFGFGRNGNPAGLIWLPLIPLFASNCMVVNAWETLGSETEKQQKRMGGTGFSLLALGSFLFLHQFSEISQLWILAGGLASICLLGATFWRPSPTWHSTGSFLADLLLVLPPIGALFLWD